MTEAELRPCVQLRGRLRRGTLFGGHQEEFQNLGLLVCEYGSDGCISPSREQSLKLLFCQADLFGIVLCQEYSDGQQHRHDHGGGHVDRSVCFVCRLQCRRRSFFLGGRQVYHHPKSTQSLPIGQFFAAFASGQTTASVALKRLVGHGPKNRFYRATRELGRVFKTEFILDYLSQPALRTRIRRGLLKGEQLHALARCVHYGRLGRLDQRDFERQTGAASCLLLILAAIIYRQIREIDRVLSEAGSDADDLNFELLSHISPIGWDNVLLYGEYQLNRSLVRSERLSV